MVNYLLKKSYRLKDLKEIEFNDLWGDHGVFTTMWIFDKPSKILFFKEHINNLVKSSNIKDYGGFTRDLSSQMMYGANEVELGKQWANNELISSLAEGCKAIGCLRRGLYITVLYKQTSTKIPGDFLGRLVLGEEGDMVKVFGATIF